MSDCHPIELYPYWFTSDSSQAVLFIVMMGYVLINYRLFIQNAVKIKIYFYCFFMILRPTIIYITHIIDLNENNGNMSKTNKNNKNLWLALLWIDDQMLYILFYYLIFVKKLIQISLKAKQQDSIDEIKKTKESSKK